MRDASHNRLGPSLRSVSILVDTAMSDRMLSGKLSASNNTLRPTKRTFTADKQGTRSSTIPRQSVDRRGGGGGGGGGDGGGDKLTT